MSNQREIAKELGLAQSTISMALRRAPGISPETCQLVEETARRLGYKENPMISTLMSHIQAGRPVSDQGCLAILVDQASESDWLDRISDTYQMLYEGYRHQAELSGFRTECFYLQAPGMTPVIIDRQLYARGITGLILSPPRAVGSPLLSMHWERYASATLNYSWLEPGVDRVSINFRHMVEMSFLKIQEMGGGRVGMCLPPEGVTGVDSSWRAGYLIAQDRLPKDQRIPMFVGKPGKTPIEAFSKWLQKWKPDVIVCLIAHEKQWLDELGISVPDEIGIVCLNRPRGGKFAGMDENHFEVGAMACNLVINKIIRNELGLSKQPKSVTIDGEWIDGESFVGR
jgi:LacI family transcriptional regulator